MISKLPAYAAAGLALSLCACASDGSSGPNASPPSRLSQAGSAVAGAASSVGSAASQVPSLVNVNLSNVLNDLAVKLNIDRSNVPVTIQLPITLAANVCGVSINVLSGSTGGKGSQCTATTAPQELAQVVQQQSAAGGSVGGGAQGGSTAATGSSTPASGTAASGATGTSANSSGTSEATTRTTPPN